MLKLNVSNKKLSARHFIENFGQKMCDALGHPGNVQIDYDGSADADKCNLNEVRQVATRISYHVFVTSVKNLRGQRIESKFLHPREYCHKP